MTEISLKELREKRRDEAHRDPLDELAEAEWESLRLLAFHGAPWNADEWLADMTREDVTRITNLINNLAASRRSALAELAARRECIVGAKQTCESVLAILKTADREGTVNPLISSSISVPVRERIDLLDQAIANTDAALSRFKEFTGTDQHEEGTI